MQDDLIVAVKELGRALANKHDTAQAAFFNGFSAELFVCCRSREDDQLCYISKYLDGNARRLIKELHEYILLREQSEERAKQ